MGGSLLMWDDRTQMNLRVAVKGVAAGIVLSLALAGFTLLLQPQLSKYALVVSCSSPSEPHDGFLDLC